MPASTKPTTHTARRKHNGRANHPIDVSPRFAGPAGILLCRECSVERATRNVVPVAQHTNDIYMRWREPGMCQGPRRSPITRLSASVAERIDVVDEAQQVDHGEIARRR